MSDARRNKPLSVAALSAIAIVSLWIGLVESARPAAASTIGNTTFYSDWFNDGTHTYVVSPLLGGVSEQVNQRYGCTLVQEDLSAGRAYGCPPANPYWHHGIDIDSQAHQWWYAGGDGTVVDTQYAALGIRDPTGKIVYYVHGDTYQVNSNASVSAGQKIAQASYPCIWPPGGGCSGTHLHLEVHNSVVGSLDTDDINPEPWLAGWQGPRVTIISPPLSGSFGSSANLGPITVQLQTATGSPITAGSSGIVVSASSSSTGGAFAFSSGGATSPNLSLTIPAGSSTVNFYYADSIVGTPTITVSAAGFNSGTQAESIGSIVSSLSPIQGSVSGGTLVTIYGSGFDPNGSLVVFGASLPVVPISRSQTQLQAYSPAQSVGVVDVMVITNRTQSVPSATDRFIYGSVSNYRGVSTQQYVLNGSDGSTWLPLDISQLTLTVVPPQTSNAVLSATASLFSSANASQDLGIKVLPVNTDCNPPQGQPAVWRESGAWSGAWRPNAITMQVSCTFVLGTIYTVQLVWKSNASTSAQIFAGAGSSPNSQTVISASLSPVASPKVVAKVSTQQYTGSNPSWSLLDSVNLTTTVTSMGSGRLSGYADLFTFSNGANIDLGVCLVLSGSDCTTNVVAWVESGGNSSFEPMASAVQAWVDLSPSQSYTVGLVWRVASAAGTVYAGAGPLAGTLPAQYSPTVLLITENNNCPNYPCGVKSTGQPTLAASASDNGTLWRDLDTANLTVSITPGRDSLAYLAANATLFTYNSNPSTPFNADLGICIFAAPDTNCDTSGRTLAAWAEASSQINYNPAASMVQVPIPVRAGIAYTIRLQWRASRAMASGSYLWSGVGSAPNSSHTSLHAALVDCPCPPPTGGNQLAFTTPPLTGTPAITGNVGPITVGLQDVRGAPVVAGSGGVIVNLYSTSSGGGFASTSGSVTTANLALTIPAGSSVTSFYYGDTLVGAPTITALATPALGLRQATQIETIANTAPRWDYRAVSTQQYWTDSDGVTFTNVDPNKFTLIINPPQTSNAVLSASASLFTSTPVNQDLAIKVSPSNTCPQGSIAAWTEAGSQATYKPNPVGIQTACTLYQNTTYYVELVWKANSAGRIYAGAGPINGSYSPTVLSASLTPVSGPLVQPLVSSYPQYTTSSQAWTQIDPNLLTTTVSIPNASTVSFVASSALFTSSSGGAKIDFGICVTSPSGLCENNVVAWTEAGTASQWKPISTTLQTEKFFFSLGSTIYTVGLVWKVSGPGTAFAGAGPINGSYSTTALLIANKGAASAGVTTQPTRSFSSPNSLTSWQDIDTANLSLTVAPSQDSVAYLTVTANLWADNPVFNGDLGICIFTVPAPACDPSGSTIVAWTETGIVAGYSPTPTTVQIPVPVWASKTYVVRAQWRRNTQSNGTLYSGAGSSPYSPTNLSARLVPLSSSSST